MKFNRLAKLLLEAPINNLEKLGDESSWKTRGAYDKKSHILINDPKFNSKLRRAFSKSKIDLNLYFLNKKELTIDDDDKGFVDLTESGMLTKDHDFWKLSGLDYNDYVKEDEITIIFNGNYGTELVELTPWMIAHRIGHAIQVSSRGQQFSSMTSAFEQIENVLGVMINDLGEHYGLSSTNNRNSWWRKFENEKKVCGILNSVGDFKSARSGKINRPYEFVYELIAQQMLTGDIKLRTDRPPIVIKPDKEEYYFDEDDYSYYYRPVDGYDFDVGNHERGLYMCVDDVLWAAVGSVYLM